MPYQHFTKQPIQLTTLNNNLFITYYRNKNQTTAHPWRDGHSISICVCGVWDVGGKDCGSSLQEGASHTYTLKLD